MPPKAKRTVKKFETSTDKKEEKHENEKENQTPDVEPKRMRNVRNVPKIQYNVTETEELSKSYSAKSQQNENLKPLGFWSKKLKDLEKNNKNKKDGLYEFSITDESESSYKKKKKPKQKPRVKKKQIPVLKHQELIIKKTAKILKPGVKTKQIHLQSLCREQIILSKERKKLADKGEKFTFSTGISSLGITSTPAVNKDNLVGASNFLFLSPIIKEEEDLHESVVDNKDPPIVILGQETPKIETKLQKISCRRVLRSGRILNM